MATIPKITIRDWVPKDSWKDLKPEVFKHLDLGSANVGPEYDYEPIGLAEKRRRYKQEQTRQNLGDKLYEVLFTNVERVIAEHSNCKKFVFYLNDISSKGLNRAISHLDCYLKRTPRDREIKIKIIKMAENFFKIDSMPRVNSATLLAPIRCPFAAIVSLTGEAVYSWNPNNLPREDILERIHRSNERIWENPERADEAKTVLNLFQHVASASQEGLLVREVDMSSGTAEAINERLSSRITMCGLTFAKADEKMKSISTCITPDGRHISGAPDSGFGIVNYVVTLAQIDS